METPVQSPVPTKDHGSEGTFKIIAFAGLLGVLALIHFLDPSFYPQIIHLARGGNIQETVGFLRSFGPWAVAISFLLDVFINAAGCLPSIFLSTANGSLRNFGGWLFLVLKGQLRGLFSGIWVNNRLPDLFLLNIGLRLICSGRSFLRFTDRLFHRWVRPFLIGKAQARLLIQTNHPLG